MNLIQFVTFLVILYAQCDFNTNGVSVEEDLRLKPEEKKILDKFKRIIIPKLPHKWMGEELYLVRFLRARNFDLKKAEQFLLANLKWRKRTRMDSIHEENWDDIKNDFPYTIDGVDKDGRPIVTASSRNWDIRNAVVTGRLRRALRYLDKALDEAYHILRRMQLEGQNVTQFVIILNMENFNLYQHGCPRCLTGILEFIDSYENHFPGMAHLISLISTPPVFESVALLVREAQSAQTREAMKIYGLDSKVWKKALLKNINADQLTREFGGTKPENVGLFRGYIDKSEIWY